jgi:hypothetical protein
MPVVRYFLCVGGVLLALLLAISAFAPREPIVASNSAPSVDRPTVRIHSDQKLPERVVYDTSLPTVVPPAATVQVAAAPPPPAAAPSAQARVRNTFAQFAPEPKESVPAESRKPEPQAPKKRKIAKIHANPSWNSPMRIAQQQPTRFAQQQPHFGFFGGPIWNNTW